MSVTLTSVLGNTQRLDGGAMFGNAPRELWAKWLAPDERNRIPLACRCLLVNDGKRRMLFETGIGAFFSPDLKARYGVAEERHVLVENLTKLGLAPSDIDVVVLSHLHFDHAGGLLSAHREGEAPRLLFSRAQYVIGVDAWERALTPHARDRASFIPELMALLRASDQVLLVPKNGKHELGSTIRFHLSNGHTPGLLLAELATSRGPVVFAADLIPGKPWVHVPITMGYDRFPELLIEEKERLLRDLHARGGWLFFTHDPSVSMGRVILDAKGRYDVTDCVPHLHNWPDEGSAS